MMARPASLSGRDVPRAWEPKSRTPRVVGSAANSSTNAVIAGFIGSCLANCTGRCHVAGLAPDQHLDHLAHVETGTAGAHLAGGSARWAAIGLQSFLGRGFGDAIEGGSSALDLGDDVVDVLGPHEGLRVVVPV